MAEADASTQLNLIGRELPNSPEAEQAVIGSVLTDPKSVALSAEIIKPDDFYFLQNREIYATVMELFNENTPVDFITVANRLTSQNKLEEIGGAKYLSHIASSVFTTQHVIYYSNIIKEKAILRNLIAGANHILEMSYNEEDKVDRILEQAEQTVFDVSSSRETNDIVPISELAVSTLNTLVENSKSTGGITGLDTGFDELNKRTGGLHGGELVLIAGRPGMGKSSFAVNIAEYVAINTNKTVAIFNLEMPKEQIVSRIISSQANISLLKMRTGQDMGDEWLSIGQHINRIANAPIFIDDTASITVSQIRAKCRRLKQSHDLQLIVIDYIQLMQSSGRPESRQQEISEISRSLKILAKELNIPVIALSQLSRTVESRSDKRPILSDLRESGAIEQDADMVMFLYRDDYYNKETADKNIAECNMAKHRNGETGVFKLGWQGEYTKFLNIEYVLKEDGNS